MPLSRVARRAYLCLGAAAVVSLPACDIPTSPPKWESEWEIPADSTRLSVSELLPASVSLAPGGQQFLLNIAPISFARTLGEMCGGACDAIDGLTVPKPAFSFTFSDDVSLPAEVASAALTGGAIDIRLQHDFSFDPLRPPGASETGTITARVLHGTSVLGSVTIAGASTAFPANTVLSRTIPLTATSITGPLRIEIALSSPAGAIDQPIVIDTSDRLTVNVAPTNLLVSTAAVRVTNQPVSIDAIEMDLADIDAFVVDRIRSGAMILTIVNPFTVSGTLSLTFNTPSGPISKPIQIQPGTNTTRLEFSGAELQRILGHVVTLSAAGSLSGTGPTVTVTPTQVLVLRSRLELVVGPKENN